MRQGGNGNRVPTLMAAGYDKQVAFLGWAASMGYATVGLSPVPGFFDDPDIGRHRRRTGSRASTATSAT